MLVLVNELFSFVKEAKSGKGQFNYVYIKMMNNKITLEQAMDQIVIEIKQSERMAYHHANNLIESW